MVDGEYNVFNNVIVRFSIGWRWDRRGMIRGATTVSLNDFVFKIVRVGVHF